MSEKTKLPNTDMRRAYYEVSDKIPELKKQAIILKDDDLLASVKKMESALKEVHQQLEEKYIWD